MKTKLLLYLAISGLSLAIGCKKKDEKTDPPLPSNVPLVTTAGVSEINLTSATSGGTITSDGGGEILSRGVICGTNPSPIVNSQTITGGTGNNFTTLLSPLSPNTHYYAWAFATNRAGLGMGRGFEFKTYSGTVTDIDGNSYKTVTIGNQVWLAENLKVTKYRNGDPIPNVTDNMQWGTLTTGAYCNYSNNITNVAPYGRLYNWHAINDTRIIAPIGWHVASDSEWQTLVDYINSLSDGYLGQSLASTSGWLENATQGNVGNDQIGHNSSGFTAVPAGYHSKDGSFYFLQETASFWTATESTSSKADFRAINKDIDYVIKSDAYKEFGYSVRCVKD